MSYCSSSRTTGRREAPAFGIMLSALLMASCHAFAPIGPVSSLLPVQQQQQQQQPSTLSFQKEDHKRVPRSKGGRDAATSRRSMMFDPSMMMHATPDPIDVSNSLLLASSSLSPSLSLPFSDVSSTMASFSAEAAAATITSSFSTPPAASTLISSNLLLSFADQGQNLAGIFFQASLLPYLVFLYFLSFRANRLNNLANYGFQFLLLFVISTIPSGIVSKSVYGVSLADVDWLHGGAEALLTLSNVLVVLGLKESMTSETTLPSVNKGRLISIAIAGAFFATLALGPGLGVDAHAPFLFGIGDLPPDVTTNLAWAKHTEPVNALSIPTWAIHFSSVFEYLFAMNLVWKFAETARTPAWKGLTWGMLPLHASGICACTYHFFYNPSALQFLVTSQAGLTLLGNLTCAIAAYRIARANGWTVNELNPLPRSETSPEGLVADGLAAMPLQLTEAKETNVQLALKLVGITVATSYLVKYGELGLDLPFEPNPLVASAMIIGIPGITAYQYYSLSDENNRNPLSFLPSMGGGGGGTDGEGNNGPSLSMADVKKYGVAGTVAYVLTELAFWIVAFPVAGYALYQSSGHWPDVIHDNTDRAAVLAFIFAGANVARLFVPVRLGAALALAPWVDENLMNRGGGNDDDDVIDMDSK